MGIASLVIGIWTVFLGFIPLLNYVALMPALIGLSLGIFELHKLKDTDKSKGIPTAGTALNSLALLSIISWTLIFSLGLSEIKDSITFERLDRDFGEYFEDDLFSDEDEPIEEDFENVNPFSDPEEPFSEKNSKRPKKNQKPYFKREFKSEEPGSFHWRFERRYHSDDPQGSQRGNEDLMEEMRKHFRSHIPKEFQKHFNFPFSPKSTEKEKGERDSKRKKPAPHELKKRYREAI